LMSEVFGSVRGGNMLTRYGGDINVGTGRNSILQTRMLPSTLVREQTTNCSVTVRALEVTKAWRTSEARRNRHRLARLDLEDRISTSWLPKT
jgi:hypothetical protein